MMVNLLNKVLHLTVFPLRPKAAGDIGRYVNSKYKRHCLSPATGETVPEENRELFILQKGNGSRKID